MRYMISAACCVLLLFLTGCGRGREKFHVVGHISGAKDTVLYFEHLSLERGPVAVDSVKLGQNGDFSFSGKPAGNPEFYRLRIGDQLINLSLDSTESIEVTASLADMALGYSVKGSGNCDTIRILNLMLHELTGELQRISDDRSLTIAEREDKISERIKEYKNEVKLTYIQNRYDQASSYFAMFQMYGGSLVFDPVGDASDVTWFSAIANAWMERWPDSPRSTNLCNIALRGHKNTRRMVLEVNLDDEKVSETGIIDMSFPDINGEERRLSDLKGKVVMLDFTAYSLKNCQERTMALRALYDKYHSQGFEIYQVSLDGDEHFWKTMCRQLPWVCVWDREGTANDIVSIYNLQQLPTWFLIDRNCDLVGRQEFMGNLEEAVQKLM
ncbi:MAG: redoxin domain-containing protein [Prevotellaceae bacterium]|nr:redoxin domain-containing protein [Prevotellaceae bacterium]